MFNSLNFPVSVLSLKLNVGNKCGKESIREVENYCIICQKHELKIILNSKCKAIDNENVIYNCLALETLKSLLNYMPIIWDRLCYIQREGRQRYFIQCFTSLMDMIVGARSD